MEHVDSPPKSLLTGCETTRAGGTSPKLNLPVNGMTLPVMPKTTTPGPLLEVSLVLTAPSTILIKLSDPADLGIASILLTGGIGLLRLNSQWLASKEAAIPALIGVAVFLSTRTRYALIRSLPYNPALMNVEKIQAALEMRANTAACERRCLNTAYLLAGTFFISTAMDYLPASRLVTSPAGGAALNADLGRLTLRSHPAIAIPCALMILAILYSLWRTDPRNDRA